MSQPRQTLRILGATLLAAAATTPAVLSADSISRSFTFQPGERLEIQTDLGHVELRRGTSGKATITVEIEHDTVAKYLDVTFQDTAEGVRVEGRKVGQSSGWLSGWLTSGNSPEIHFTVELPERADVDLKTGGGHVNLSDDVQGEVALSTSGGHIGFADIDGRLTAHTSGGHIQGGTISQGGSVDTAGGHVTIGGAGKDLEASTSGGHIRVGKVAGSIRLSTSGGHVTAEGCEGDAEVSTSGGNISLREMGGHVRARTSGGRVTLSVSEGNDAGADLATSGGSILVELPGGVGFKLDASADGGQVDADLPGLRREGGSDRDHLVGTIGSGGNLLRLRSSQGNIRITASGGTI